MELFLFNPFTGARIKLPRWDRTRIKRVVLSSAPTEPNCTVILLEDAFWAFKFCRVGDDEWQVEKFFPATAIDALVFKRRKLYLLSYATHSLSAAEATIAAANTATQFELEFLELPAFPLIQSAHLVESGEELLAVVRYAVGEFPFCYVDFEVLRWDMRTSSWVWKRKIGNRVLFLGDKHFGDYSASFNATEIGCKGNRIYYQYFTDRHTWWVFNLKNRSFKHASWDSVDCGSMIGITPSLV